LIKRLYTLDLAEQNEGVQVVVGKDQLLQLGKLPELVEIGMINDEVKSYVSEMHFFNDIIEF